MAPIDRLRRAGWELIQWRDFDGDWQRPPFDRSSRIDELVQLLNGFTELLEPPGSANDTLYADSWAARKLAEEIRRTESVASRDYDRLEAGLIELEPQSRTLKTRAKGAARITVAASCARMCCGRAKTCKTLLTGFEADANADLAAALRHELRGCVSAYEAAKAKAGALDFLDLLLKTRDLIRDNSGGARRASNSVSNESSSTSSRTRIRCRPRSCCFWLPTIQRATNWRETRPVRREALFGGRSRSSRSIVSGAPMSAFIGSVYEMLQAAGARRVTLRTSFRARPNIQRAINAAFEPVMTGDDDGLQAAYVPLEPFRNESEEQPSVVVLPVPEPYGYRRLSNLAIEKSLPDAVGAFIDWLIQRERLESRRAAGGGEIVASTHCGAGLQARRNGASRPHPGSPHLPAVPPLHQLPRGHDAALRRGTRSARDCPSAGRRPLLSQSRGDRDVARRPCRYRMARR